jgi:hypothetical protein
VFRPEPRLPLLPGEPGQLLGSPPPSGRHAAAFSGRPVPPVPPFPQPAPPPHPPALPAGRIFQGAAGAAVSGADAAAPPNGSQSGVGGRCRSAPVHCRNVRRKKGHCSGPCRPIQQTNRQGPAVQNLFSQSREPSSILARDTENSAGRVMHAASGPIMTEETTSVGTSRPELLSCLANSIPVWNPWFDLKYIWRYPPHQAVR